MKNVHVIYDYRDIDVTKIRGSRAYQLNGHIIVVMQYAHGCWGVELRTLDDQTLRVVVAERRNRVLEAVREVLSNYTIHKP